MTLEHILHLNFTDCFEGKSLALNFINDLKILSKNLYFFSLIRGFTLARVSHLQTLYITNASSEEEPRQFLIYHYITG